MKDILKLSGLGLIILIIVVIFAITPILTCGSLRILGLISVEISIKSYFAILWLQILAIILLQARD